MGKVKKFLSNYINYNTRRNYELALTDFFKATYGEANRKKLDSQGEKYFGEERDYKEDINTFLKYLNGRAPLTVKLEISQIKNFLIENDVELPQKFWRQLRRRIKGTRALTLDKIPSNAELRQLITHMPVQGKSLFLLLESSGLRIGESLQLKLDDLALEETPARVQVRGEYTKTGNSRHAFISREAKEAISEWLKVRRDYLDAATRKSHKYDKSIEDDRLFPFESSTAYMIWRGALKKAGLAQRDKSTNIRKLHPHVLRKFFRTRLGAIIPVDVVEALMGHEGYLTEVYRRYTVEDLAKFYLKGESALLVFTDAAEVTRLRQEVDERSKVLQTLVNGLTAENLEVKSKVAKVELENTDLKGRIGKLEETMNETRSDMKLLLEKISQLES